MTAIEEAAENGVFEAVTTAVANYRKFMEACAIRENRAETDEDN